MKLYEYWSARAENGENAEGMDAFKPKIPASHKAVNLVQKPTQYDLPAYISPGEPCLPWCHVDVEVDAAAAAAAGRVTFPPDNIATWYAPPLVCAPPSPRRPDTDMRCAHPAFARGSRLNLVVTRHPPDPPAQVGEVQLGQVLLRLHRVLPLHLRPDV